MMLGNSGLWLMILFIFEAPNCLKMVAVLGYQWGSNRVCYNPTNRLKDSCEREVEDVWELRGNRRKKCKCKWWHNKSQRWENFHRYGWHQLFQVWKKDGKGDSKSR
jgi:hypothetical protein